MNQTLMIVVMVVVEVDMAVAAQAATQSTWKAFTVNLFRGKQHAHHDIRPLT